MYHLTERVKINYQKKILTTVKAKAGLRRKRGSSGETVYSQLSDDFERLDFDESENQIKKKVIKSSSLGNQAEKHRRRRKKQTEWKVLLETN